jgi:hypothetical protein
MSLRERGLRGNFTVVRAHFCIPNSVILVVAHVVVIGFWVWFFELVGLLQPSTDFIAPFPSANSGRSDYIQFGISLGLFIVAIFQGGLNKIVAQKRVGEGRSMMRVWEGYSWE